MITKQDLLEAIAECQGVRDPRANTAIKLAAFYTILDHLEYDERPQPKMVQNEYSFSGLGESNEPEKIHTDGGSDFLGLIDGKSQSDVWPEQYCCCKGFFIYILSN